MGLNYADRQGPMLIELIMSLNFFDQLRKRRDTFTEEDKFGTNDISSSDIMKFLVNILWWLIGFLFALLHFKSINFPLGSAALMGRRKLLCGDTCSSTV